MKTVVLTLILIAVCSLAIADIGPFTSRGFGHFNGKLATYASGDTIIFVNNSNSSSDPSQTGHIIFNISIDGGVSWIAQEISEVDDCLTQPTLTVTPGEILVSYTNGTFRKLAHSSDGGTQWQISDAGKTFENSPVVEKMGTEYRSFGLDLPFPEYYQDSYTMPGDPEEFIRPQYFTQEESSMNDTPVYYWGPDVVQGTVRSNSDIWLKQAGGGTNNGWPTFYGPVITSGEIISIPSIAPLDEIFLGGYIEHAPELDYEPLSLANMQGVPIGPSEYDPNLIVMVQVSGSSYSMMLGHVTPRTEQAFVYSEYPATPLSEPLFTNTYATADTIWTLGTGGSCYNQTMLCNNKLWIKGSFAGQQTWVSSDTIMIIGDITLICTDSGEAPDDPQGMNYLDSVKLIAGRSVLLKYGYKNPIDSSRVHPLCRADDHPVYIYASIYALGDHPTNPRKDGIFTFEYQHPHPAVPAVIYNNELWDNIDLHRRRFPQTAAEPWPPNIDYPRYNPLWPERQPYLERGRIQLWGAVYQNRRGFLHRNVHDSEHQANGIWDIENDYCGGTSYVNYTDPVLGIQMNNINYPGATGGGVGYKKDFHFDSRFPLSESPGLWKLGMNISELSFPAEGVQFDNLQRKEQLRKTHSKAYARNGDMALYASNDQLLKSEGDSFTDLSSETSGDGNIQSVTIASDGSATIYQLEGIDSFYAMHFKRFNSSGSIIFDGSLGAQTPLNDLVRMPDGRIVFASYRETGHLKLWELLPGDEQQEIASWPLNLLPIGDPALTFSRLYLVPSAPDEVEVFLWLRSGNPDEANQPGTIYHARATFPVSNNDPASPPVQNISFSSYPNPMRDELKLDLEIPSASSHRIDIFNLRGQKVTSLSDASNKTGKLNYIWNGTDASGRTCAPGIYLIKLYVDDKPIRSKRICRI